MKKNILFIGLISLVSSVYPFSQITQDIQINFQGFNTLEFVEDISTLQCQKKILEQIYDAINNVALQTMGATSGLTRKNRYTVLNKFKAVINKAINDKIPQFYENVSKLQSLQKTIKSPEAKRIMAKNIQTVEATIAIFKDQLCTLRDQLNLL